MLLYLKYSVEMATFDCDKRSQILIRRCPQVSKIITKNIMARLALD